MLPPGSIPIVQNHELIENKKFRMNTFHVFHAFHKSSKAMLYSQAKHGIIQTKGNTSKRGITLTLEKQQ